MLPLEIWHEIFIWGLQELEPVIAARFLCEQRLVCSAFYNIIDSDHIWREILQILEIHHDLKKFTRAQAQVRYLVTYREFKLRVEQGLTKRNDHVVFPVYFRLRSYFTPRMIAKELQSQVRYYDGNMLCFAGAKEDLYRPDDIIIVKIDGDIPLFKLIDIPKYQSILIFAIPDI
jgi:hypothetical protein